MSELLAAWERLEETVDSSPECWTRLHPESAVDLTAVLLRDGMRVAVRLTVRSDAIPPGITFVSTDGFTVRSRVDGGATKLTVALETPAFRDVFAAMCEDIVARIADTASEAAAVRALVGRLKTWRRLFLGSGVRPLNDREQLGLYGELLLLEQLVAKGDASRALAAWKGPDHSLHDFELGTLHVEVKTSGDRDGTVVSVGSLEQLDPESVSRLLLWHFTLRASDDGRTLATVVCDLSTALAAPDGKLAHMFEDRLLCAGYLALHRAAYDLHPMRATAQRVFQVKGDFPGLSRATVPSAVQRARYDLDVAQVPSSFTLAVSEALSEVEYLLIGS